MKITLAIGLPLLFIIYLFNMDIYHGHSKRRLLMIPLVGLGVVMLAYLILNVIFSHFINIDFFSHNLKDALIAGFFGAGMIEEWCKLIGVLILIYFIERTEREYDIILFTCSIGTLFAGMENMIIPRYFEPTSLLLRLFTAVPAHILFSFVMSIIIYKMIKSKQPLFKISWLIAAVFIPASIHAGFNYFIYFIEQSQVFTIGFKVGIFSFIFIFLAVFIFFIRNKLIVLNRITIFESK